MALPWGHRREPDTVLGFKEHSCRSDEIPALTLIKSRGYRVIRHIQIKNFERHYERDIRFSWEESKRR